MFSQPFITSDLLFATATFSRSSLQSAAGALLDCFSARIPSLLSLVCESYMSEGLLSMGLVLRRTVSASFLFFFSLCCPVPFSYHCLAFLRY